MNDEKLDKIFNGINSKSYKNLKYYSLGVSLLGLITLFGSNASNILPVILGNIFWIGGYFSTKTLSENNFTEFTKSFVPIKSDYDKYLENYCKLMDSLDINDLKELCFAYSYMFHNGYMSLTHEHSYDVDDTFESKRFGLISLFNGHGVCRHVSCGLKSILNEYGYQASSIPVYTRSNQFLTQEDIDIMRDRMIKDFEISHPNSSQKEKEHYVDTMMNVIIATTTINSMINNGDSKHDEKISKRLGNHCIVLASSDGLSIAYDPQSTITYQPDKKSGVLRDVLGLGFEYKDVSKKPFNTPEEIKYISKNFDLPGMELYDDFKLKHQVEDNLDECQKVLENFRTDNLELMGSLCEKAKELKIVGFF